MPALFKEMDVYDHYDDEIGATADDFEDMNGCSKFGCFAILGIFIAALLFWFFFT